MRFTPIFLFSLASSGWANAAVLNTNNTNFGKENHAPLDLASDSGQDLDSINFKEQPENTIGSSNSTSQNSVSAVSPSVNLTDVAFFVKNDNGKFMPLFTANITQKDLTIYAPFFSFLEVPPRNFSLVGTKLTLNEGKMAGHQVGFHNNILSFGNHTKAADFRIDEDGRVHGNYSACSLGDKEKYIIHKTNEPMTYCPAVELYLLPSFKPNFTGEYNIRVLNELKLHFLLSSTRNHTYVIYTHGNCEYTFRDDWTAKTFVEIKQLYESNPKCMTPKKSSPGGGHRMGAKELQKRSCILHFHGYQIPNFMQTFLKGFEGECEVFINDHQVFREAGKSWANSTIMAWVYGTA